ncbi:MAG: hypothetical protein HKO70_01010 [Acidimicrobiia bacterium]|nr:hypothetical protein [Acidimicrobiia bacterium]
MRPLADERGFFDLQWPALQATLEQDGPDAVARAILRYESDAERVALFRFARQGIVIGDWEGKNLNAALVVAEAAIAWLDERARGAAGPDRTSYLAALAEITFNAAADVADCWTDDDEPRRRDHFARAMAIAEKSVGLREELGKSDNSKHLGWWAFGYHQLRLGLTGAAADSLERSLEHARRAARGAGEPDGVTSQAPFAVLISAGYLGLARIADGEPSGPDLYGEAIAAFQAQLSDPERQADARFGLDQLALVRSRLR